MLSIYFYVYNLAMAKSDKDKPIWVSKPKPTLPFGLGPPPEPLKPEDFDETTYGEHEKKLLLEAAKGILMSGAISFFMSMKFNVHMSLLIQSVMMPLNAFDMIVLKKYILGLKKNNDGSNLYHEFLIQPTEKVLAIAENVKNARAAQNEQGTFSPAIAKSAISPDEPRVVELVDEDEAPKQQTPKKKSTAAAVYSEPGSAKEEETVHHGTPVTEID